MFDDDNFYLEFDADGDTIMQDKNKNKRKYKEINLQKNFDHIEICHKKCKYDISENNLFGFDDIYFISSNKNNPKKKTNIYSFDWFNILHIFVNEYNNKNRTYERIDTLTKLEKNIVLTFGSIIKQIYENLAKYDRNYKLIFHLKRIKWEDKESGDIYYNDGYTILIIKILLREYNNILNKIEWEINIAERCSETSELDDILGLAFLADTLNEKQKNINTIMHFSNDKYRSYQSIANYVKYRAKRNDAVQIQNISKIKIKDEFYNFTKKIKYFLLEGNNFPDIKDIEKNIAEIKILSYEKIHFYDF
jgi:hypothetical protein